MPLQEPNEMDRLFHLWEQAAEIVKKYKGDFKSFLEANQESTSTEPVKIEVTVSKDVLSLLQIGQEIEMGFDGEDSGVRFKRALVISGILQVMGRIAEVMNTFQQIRPLLNARPKGEN